MLFKINNIGDESSEVNGLLGKGTHRLTLYIAIPVTIFVICLCVLAYCLISRQSDHYRQNNGVRRQRNYFTPGQRTQMKSLSATSSSSVGVCRNGNATQGNWNPSNNTGDLCLRPSSTGTTLGNPILGYSSTNGSNSINGTNPMNTQLSLSSGFQSGPMHMIPVSYPMIMQPINMPQQQQQTQQSQIPPFYPVSDLNSYSPQMPIGTTICNSEFFMPNNGQTMANNACYPGAMIYPITNGHLTNSPESSAVTGAPNSQNDLVEGRLVFRNGVGSYQTPNQNMRSFNYVPSQPHVPSPNATEYDIALSNQVNNANSNGVLLLNYSNNKESINPDSVRA